MKVWIDFSNSPHPLLFEPVARRLEREGHRVLITARDNAQTAELTRARWPAAEMIGGPSPGGRAAKAAAMLDRVRSLTRWAREHRPDAAVSHNSFAQLAAARAASIPALNAMDYEHQPANHISFRLATRLMLPQALEATHVRRFGASERKTSYYDGLKEELYLAGFRPNSGVERELGIERPAGELLVVARTPPSGALYHRGDNPLFRRILEGVAQQGGVHCVVLTRRPEQREELARMNLPGVVLPERAIDSRSLMYAADLVVGAGGTMTREAALLGVPTVSVFAGATAAVDRWLQDRGSLRRLESIEDVLPVVPRDRDPADLDELAARGERLVGEFVRGLLTLPRIGEARLRPAQAHG